jgi:hypothetical protein
MTAHTHAPRESVANAPVEGSVLNASNMMTVWASRARSGCLFDDRTRMTLVKALQLIATQGARVSAQTAIHRDREGLPGRGSSNVQPRFTELPARPSTSAGGRSSREPLGTFSLASALLAPALQITTIHYPCDVHHNERVTDVTL